MSRLVRVIALALALSAVALPASASAQRPGPLGRQLVGRFLKDLERTNRADIRRFLSPAFQLQRADGSHQTKAEVIKNPTKIQGYTVRGFQVTSDANVLVVTFQLSVNETINGKPFKTGFAPRIGTFVSLAKGWQLIEWANFNTPQ